MKKGLQWLAAARMLAMVATLVSLSLSLLVGGEETVGGSRKTNSSESLDEPVNWELPTLGGIQFWTDLRFRSGWRIQQHCWTKHCRVLDPNNVRRAWGTREQCYTRLQDFILSEHIKPNQETVVVLLHGLGRTRGCWSVMKSYVEERTDWQPIEFTYASTRCSIEDHALALQAMIASLGSEVSAIHLVGHSLGNIVFRRYLGLCAEGNSLDVDQAKLQRVVMIAPPNQGSAIARLLHPSGIFPVVAGKSGVELGRGWERLVEKLAIPQQEFAIIAGANPNKSLLDNPLLDGPDDMLVSLAETKLDGAKDELVGPWEHTLIMQEADVCEACLRFLQTGSFRE